MIVVTSTTFTYHGFNQVSETQSIVGLWGVEILFSFKIASLLTFLVCIFIKSEFFVDNSAHPSTQV